MSYVALFVFVFIFLLVGIPLMAFYDIDDMKRWFKKLTKRGRA